MKIIYNENPLRTRVELDEHERQVFWLKIKIEEMQDRLFNAHFHLTEEGQFFSLDDARKAVDPAYYLQEEDQEKVGLDKRVDTLFAHYVADLLDTHCGDCTCVPCSCSKCRAEEILGINTLEPFPGKHELHYIESAFTKNNSIAEALAYLKQPISKEKPEAWKNSTREDYEQHIPRWEGEKARAYEYLKNYADKHFGAQTTGKPAI